MNRRHTLAGALAVYAVAALADRSAHAEPPMVRAPAPQAAQPALRPAIPVVEPHAAAAAVQAARKSSASVSAHPSLIDAQRATLQPYEKADGPTWVLTASSPVVPGKARIWYVSAAAQTTWDTDADQIVVDYNCPQKMGMDSNACTYNYYSAFTVITANVNADSAHGYLFNCFLSNGGHDAVPLNGGALTLAPGHGTWLSADIKPGAMAPGWEGGMNGLLFWVKPPNTAYNATFAVTRCEVTPYTVPQPPSPSAGH